jgi:hypothetical protein
MKVLIPVPLRVHRAGAEPFEGARLASEVGTDNEDSGYGLGSEHRPHAAYR